MMRCVRFWKCRTRVVKAALAGQAHADWSRDALGVDTQVLVQLAGPASTP